MFPVPRPLPFQMFNANSYATFWALRLRDKHSETLTIVYSGSDTTCAFRGYRYEDFCNKVIVPLCGWTVSRAFARHPKGRGFESRPVRFQVTAWASCSHAFASVTKQYNLVPADGRRRSSAGKVTAGLAESNGSLPPGGWLQATCGLTACTPGSAPGPTLGNEYGRTLPFYYYYTNVALPVALYRCDHYHSLLLFLLL